MTLYAEIKALGDVSWMVDAMCKGTPSVWWFPDSNKPSSYAKARLICDKCPVADECLDYALRNDERWWGMYGGTIPAERRVMLGLKPRRQMDGLG